MEEREMIEDEIRQEFQVERMILFSDAVFAIVITLMAIEIRLPEGGHFTAEDFPKLLAGLLPVLIAYTTTFFFIGQIWYEHLQVCSFLRDYDKGLIIRNLLMLFFIGLFPFSVTIIARPHKDFFLPVTIYFAVILLCKSAQLVLQHYILVKRPNLRRKANTDQAIFRFKKGRFTIILLTLMFLLVTGTSMATTDPNIKTMAFWWAIPFPFIMRYYQRKMKKQLAVKSISATKGNG